MYLRHHAYTLHYRHVCILVFLHVFAFSMLLRCMLKFKRLACGIEDVTQYNYSIQFPVTMTTIRHCSILEFGRGASNQAVAPGITRPLHATVYSISYWQGLELCFGGLSPRGDGTTWLPTNAYFENCITNRARWDIRLLDAQQLLQRLISLAIALNNFIQYSHCQVVQPFR